MIGQTIKCRGFSGIENEVKEEFRRFYNGELYETDPETGERIRLELPDYFKPLT